VLSVHRSFPDTSSARTAYARTRGERRRKSRARFKRPRKMMLVFQSRANSVQFHFKQVPFIQRDDFIHVLTCNSIQCFVETFDSRY